MITENFRYSFWFLLSLHFYFRDSHSQSGQSAGVPQSRAKATENHIVVLPPASDRRLRPGLRPGIPPPRAWKDYFIRLTQSRLTSLSHLFSCFLSPFLALSYSPVTPQRPSLSMLVSSVILCSCSHSHDFLPCVGLSSSLTWPLSSLMVCSDFVCTPLGFVIIYD